MLRVIGMQDMGFVFCARGGPLRALRMFVSLLDNPFFHPFSHYPTPALGATHLSGSFARYGQTSWGSVTAFPAPRNHRITLILLREVRRQYRVQCSAVMSVVYT